MPKTPGIESTQIYTEARNLYSEIKSETGSKARRVKSRLDPFMNGQTSCQVFFSWKPIFSKLERRKIYDMVLARFERILASINQFDKSAREAAWRIAVECWLQSKGFIKVHIPKKVSPNFTPIFCS